MFNTKQTNYNYTGSLKANASGTIQQVIIFPLQGNSKSNVRKTIHHFLLTTKVSILGASKDFLVLR